MYKSVYFYRDGILIESASILIEVLSMECEGWESRGKGYTVIVE